MCHIYLANMNGIWSASHFWLLCAYSASKYCGNPVSYTHLLFNQPQKSKATELYCHKCVADSFSKFYWFLVNPSGVDFFFVFSIHTLTTKNNILYLLNTVTHLTTKLLILFKTKNQENYKNCTCRVFQC